tara:strand:+ start:115 stop:231 length:117 start_codon:yes stop_codon:yes gene_type:complete
MGCSDDDDTLFSFSGTSAGANVEAKIHATGKADTMTPS